MITKHAEIAKDGTSFAEVPLASLPASAGRTQASPGTRPIGPDENSPALQGWDFGGTGKLLSPIGTTEAILPNANDRVHVSRPDGTKCTSQTRDPAMNRWAIFDRPSGANRR